ncbi:MAG: hypothetical protein LBP28_03405 [Coriobacteriales bacterium]|jgi:hypothetical protein|nr:hypothetical protein [Coriobacteriales bacterium]
MRFYNVEAETAPEVTGSKNGVYSVEIKDRHSFASMEDKGIWKDYCTENRRDKSRVLLNHYVPLDTALLTDPITFFPIGKRIEQLDFMAHAPYVRGLQFLVTQRVYEVISKYRLPVHSKVLAKIDTFDQSYYLIGFPLLGADAYDFDKSTFWDHRSGTHVRFRDAEDYETAEYERLTASAQSLYLNERVEYDIVKTTKGVFFSSDIIGKFEREGITGYRIAEGVLEN